MEKIITFEPLDGFSNFKKVNHSKFCQESIDTIGIMELHLYPKIGGSRFILKVPALDPNHSPMPPMSYNTSYICHQVLWKKAGNLKKIGNYNFKKSLDPFIDNPCQTKCWWPQSVKSKPNVGSHRLVSQTFGLALRKGLVTTGCGYQHLVWNWQSVVTNIWFGIRICCYLTISAKPNVGDHRLSIPNQLLVTTACGHQHLVWHWG